VAVKQDSLVTRLLGSSPTLTQPPLQG
jgi:hypothetical protein